MLTRKQFDLYGKDPSAFREALSIDVDGTVRPFGPVMDDWRRSAFTSLDPALKRCAGRRPRTPAKMRAWIERPGVIARRVT